MSSYVAIQGARRVVCLDPAAAGSNVVMEGLFQSLNRALGSSVHVERRRERLQGLGRAGERFDVVLVHKAVNHLDEAARAALPARDAREAYRRILHALHDLVADSGDLIVAACARRNLCGDSGLPNIFAPSIDWRIHQQPETWISLLSSCGFSNPRVRWDVPGRMSSAGQFLFGNRVGAYLTSSHHHHDAARKKTE